MLLNGDGPVATVVATVISRQAVRMRRVINY